MVQGAGVGERRLTMKGHKGTFFSDGNVLYFDWLWLYS